MMTYSVTVSRLLRTTTALATGLLLAGCVTSVADFSSVQHDAREASVIYTSPVRNSATPLSEPLACFGRILKERPKGPLGIAIGDIKDYTGKQGQDEGFAITQGGALMAYSALGKLGQGVRVHERFDTRIAEAELVYMNQRQLGDGNFHSIDDVKSGKQASVPWKPYFGGTIRQSDYFIVGGITELNYNIQSGGGEVAVSSVGPKARVYTMNIAVDLRIVGTQSLMVYHTVSVEKQLSGYEVGFGIFRFFGSELFDVNVGAKNAEPLQLGVRMAIEASILQLVASVAGDDPTPCMPPELGPARWDGANAAAVHAAEQESVSTQPPVQIRAPILSNTEDAEPATENADVAKAAAETASSELETPTTPRWVTAPKRDGYTTQFDDAFGMPPAIPLKTAACLVGGQRSADPLADARGPSGRAAAGTEALQNACTRPIIVGLMHRDLSGGPAQAPSLVAWVTARFATADDAQGISRSMTG